MCKTELVQSLNHRKVLYIENTDKELKITISTFKKSVHATNKLSCINQNRPGLLGRINNLNNWPDAATHIIIMRLQDNEN